MQQQAAASQEVNEHPSSQSDTVVVQPREIVIEVVKKTKKNEPKFFRALCQIDRDAFDKHGDSGMMVKTFWKSTVNKIIVARKKDTQAIVGYAAFLVQEPSKAYVQKQRQIQKRHHIKVAQGSYLMRIGVRARCQRQGIGRKLIEYLFEHFPAHLSLDVSTDNDKAMNFYKRMGLNIDRLYLTEEQKIEFASFGTPEDFVYVPSPPRFNNVIEASKAEEIKHDENVPTQSDLALTKMPRSAAQDELSCLDLHEEVSMTTNASLTDDKLASTKPLFESPATNTNSDEETSSSSEAASTGIPTML